MTIGNKILLEKKVHTIYTISKNIIWVPTGHLTEDWLIIIITSSPTHKDVLGQYDMIE